MKHKQSKQNTASENASLASTSSLNDDMNDKRNVKKQIVIKNIISPNVKSDGEFFDFITTRQILSDIDVTSNVAIIRRIESQQILVRFHRNRDCKMALKNAKNLQNFAEWRHLRLKPYEPPKETDESTESLHNTVLSDPNTLPNPFINFASDNTVDSKSINILVIGASGIGKSTWINGMANYMNFNSFNDARFADEITCLIPMKFNFPYGKENLVNVKTTIGKSNNKQESLARGQSATQQPKVYRYVTDLYDFNLIDTPGICDTRGVEYDIENIKMIMECMSQWDVIHGVCILLKPNEARLKLSLRYCLHELLVNLHKECIPNIAVVFTNTCTTLYRPGETLTLLHKMTEKIKEEYGSEIVFDDKNTFCIENEAIKPLYAYHNGIELDECIIDDCSNSWEHTVSESYKMFEYFASLTPHSVSKTTATSQARGILRELCMILDEVHLEISQNDRLHNEQTKQLKILENNLTEHKNGNCQGEFVEKTYISHPVTVCSGPNCVEPARSPNSNEFKLLQKTLLHILSSNEWSSGKPNRTSRFTGLSNF
jgi:predicted GTPase